MIKTAKMVPSEVPEVAERQCGRVVGKGFDPNLHGVFGNLRPSVAGERKSQGEFVWASLCPIEDDRYGN